MVDIKFHLEEDELEDIHCCADIQRYNEAKIDLTVEAHLKERLFRQVSEFEELFIDHFERFAPPKVYILDKCTSLEYCVYDTFKKALKASIHFYSRTSSFMLDIEYEEASLVADTENYICLECDFKCTSEEGKQESCPECGASIVFRPFVFQGFFIYECLVNQGAAHIIYRCKPSGDGKMEEWFNDGKRIDKNTRFLYRATGEKLVERLLGPSIPFDNLIFPVPLTITVTHDDIKHFNFEIPDEMVFETAWLMKFPPLYKPLLNFLINACGFSIEKHLKKFIEDFIPQYIKDTFSPYRPYTEKKYKDGGYFKWK